MKELPVVIALVVVPRVVLIASSPSLKFKLSEVLLGKVSKGVAVSVSPKSPANS